mmetsp:Transcript_12609/g.18861  ORF Transcript_12609/g.18861 Transcript_12609/m.18861 type:complete len:458 (+) Transcript_12609:89-1462(+)
MALQAAAKKYGFPSAKTTSQEFAIALDNKDPLGKFRSQFHIPKTESEKKGVDPEFGDAPSNSIYFCGNSLGLMSKRVDKLVQEEMNKWKARGVEGHFEGKRPWAKIDEFVTEKMAPIVGAKHSSEVAVMNTLSMNLHVLLTSFYQPTKSRFKIIMEDHAFCSDHHVIRSQIRLRGLNPKDVIHSLSPKTEKKYLTTEEILGAIEKLDESLALVFLGGVQYYTGQFYDIKTIAAKARKHGALVGIDLAHAVGNVPLRMHDWEVDFAAWCTYKYLNAGPGSIAGIFVHEKHHKKEFKDLPIMAGWWGQTPETRFKMAHEWEGLPGAQAWQVSNPAVLPTVCLLASLQLFEEAGGMPAIRSKSLLLTGFLELLIKSYIPEKKAKIISPSDPERRGCQLSILTSVPVRGVHQKLTADGIIVDVREPNVIRVAPCPLYNTFSEVFRFVMLLKKALDSTKSSL